jgi:hypothetical protein
VEIYASGGEFWACLRAPYFYAIPRGGSADCYLMLTKLRAPRTGALNLDLSVRVPIPTADKTGALPDPPPEGTPLADRRWCLGGVLDARHEPGEDPPEHPLPVDPRRFASLAVVRPGVFNDDGSARSPTTVYAYAALKPTGTTALEVASARAEAARRASLTLAGVLGPAFAGAQLRAVCLDGMDYAALHELAESCFGQLGKAKQGGFLTFSEFTTVLAQLGVAHTEARAFVWFDCADADGSGTMEFDEFLQLMAMVSRVETPAFLTLWDVYTLYAVDNAAEAEAYQRALRAYKDGVVGARMPDPRPPVRLTLPRVDLLALGAILKEFRYESGIVLSDAKLSAMFRLSDSRTNAGSLGYGQVKALWLELVSPRAELAKRGISVPALLAERAVPDASDAALRAYLDKVVAGEDAALGENLLAALGEAEALRRAWAREREAAAAAAAENRLGDRAAAREAAELERQARRAR